VTIDDAVRQELVLGVLEDEADDLRVWVARQSAAVAPEHRHGPRGRSMNASQVRNERRLTGPVRTDDRRQTTLGDRAIHVTEHGRSIRIAKRQPADLNRGHGSVSPSSKRGRQGLPAGQLGGRLVH
jgi:hypothetical protein